MPQLAIAAHPTGREGFHLIALNSRGEMIADVTLTLVTSNRRNVWLASGSAWCSKEGRPIKILVSFGGYVLWSGPARKKYIDWTPAGEGAERMSLPPHMNLTVKEWPVRLEAAFQ